jgi:hypothetical protein
MPLLIDDLAELLPNTGAAGNERGNVHRGDGAGIVTAADAPPQRANAVGLDLERQHHVELVPQELRVVFRCELPERFDVQATHSIRLAFVANGDGRVGVPGPTGGPHDGCSNFERKSRLEVESDDSRVLPPRMRLLPSLLDRPEREEQSVEPVSGTLHFRCVVDDFAVEQDLAVEHAYFGDSLDPIEAVVGRRKRGVQGGRGFDARRFNDSPRCSSVRRGGVLLGSARQKGASEQRRQDGERQTA